MRMVIGGCTPVLNIKTMPIFIHSLQGEVIMFEINPAMHHDLSSTLSIGEDLSVQDVSPILGADTWRDASPPSNSDLLNYLQRLRCCDSIFSQHQTPSPRPIPLIPLCFSGPELIDRLEDLGVLRMVLVHNHGGMVTTGRMRDARHRKHRSSVTAHPIDTRLRHHQWRNIYAVGGRYPGIYVTDREQRLALAWILAQGSRSRAFAALCADGSCAADGFSTIQSRAQRHQRLSDRNGSEVRAHLLEQWQSMVDTHQFGPLLSRLRLSTQQAYILAEEVYTRRVPIDCLSVLSSSLIKQQIPAMVFMENDAGISIHSGSPFYTTSDSSSRIGRLSDGEHHWLLDAIDGLWLVTRPSREGDVHSLEAFDERGHPVVKFFGQRPWKSCEDPRWLPLLVECTGIQALPVA
ncbi:MAG: hypothetical protein EA401_02350 [Planctomycetota bacterium]|nr:MAG: hypothetical protein EA401_02350 [Planctomycetota bacterium]